MGRIAKPTSDEAVMGNLLEAALGELPTVFMIADTGKADSREAKAAIFFRGDPVETVLFMLRLADDGPPEVMAVLRCFAESFRANQKFR